MNLSQSCERQYELTAIILLTVVALTQSVILLAIEPGMGFRGVADYFDLEKVVPASSSTAWNLSNLSHLVQGGALLILCTAYRSSSNASKTTIAMLALVAAPLSMVVGLSGFVLEFLVHLLPDGAARDASLYGLLATRTTLLVTVVAILGLLFLTFSLSRELVASWLRLLGLPIGVAAILFVFYPTPMPLLLFVWWLSYFIETMIRNNS